MRQIGFVGLLVVLSACADGEAKQGTAEIDAVQAYIVRDFIDPDSAQFRNVRVRQGYVCGEVNGKNRFGGYTGFQQFHGLYENGTATGEMSGDVAVENELYCDSSGKPLTNAETELQIEAWQEREEVWLESRKRRFE